MKEETQHNLEEIKEPKKLKTKKIVLIVFLIFLLLKGVGVFWAYREITSIVEASDLGVSYSIQDYEDLVQNIGIDVEAEKLCLDCEPLEFSEPHDVDLIITNEQASAAFEYANTSLSFAKIDGSQIRFTENMGELVTTVTYQGRNYPVYISGNVQKATENTVTGEIFDLKIGGLNIPSSLKNMAEEAIVNLANDRIATMGDSFRIDEIQLTNEGLSFEGMAPTEAN